MSPALGIWIHYVGLATLRASLVFVTPLAFLVATLLFWRASRSYVARRASVGLAAGLVATLAYDAFRLMAGVLGVVSHPFRSIELFGLVIVGPEAPHTARVAGWLFHFWNGASFGMFFGVVFRPTILRGIIWGLVLELALVIVSPRLLALTLRDELLAMSVLGHVAYGAALATTIKHGVRGTVEASRRGAGA